MEDSPVIQQSGWRRFDATPTVDLTAQGRLAHWGFGSTAGGAMRQRMTGYRMAAVLGLLLLAQPSLAAPACQTSGTFERWLEGFKQEAAVQGISRQAIAAALNGVTYDPAVI